MPRLQSVGIAHRNNINMSYRNSQFYTSNEVRFYISLRRKQLIGGVKEASGITEDEVVTGDLRNLYTRDNPEWVLAWDEREKLRQEHKKQLEKIESDALKSSPVSPVGKTERGREVMKA